MDYSEANRAAVQSGTDHREKMKKTIALVTRLTVFTLAGLFLLAVVIVMIRSNLTVGAGTAALPNVPWIWIIVLSIIGAAIAMAYKYDKKWQRIAIGVVAAILALVVIFKLPPFLPEGNWISSRNTGTPSSSVGSSKPAVSASSAPSDADCPNFTPKMRTIDTRWVEVNPGHACAFVYSILEGKIELGGPGGSWIPDTSEKGRTGHQLVTKVRATTGQATVLYTFCRIGKQPDDDSAVCKS